MIYIYIYIYIINMLNYCEHCNRGPYSDHGHTNHLRKCPVLRRNELARIKRKKQRAESARFADVQDVDFGEAREQLQDVIDHNAQPTMVPDQLVAVPSLRQSAAAARNNPNIPISVRPIEIVPQAYEINPAEADQRLERDVIIEDIVLSDDDEPHEFPPDYDTDDDEDYEYDEYDHYDYSSALQDSVFNSERTGIIVEPADTPPQGGDPIIPQNEDPFHPDNFNEDNMDTIKFVPSKNEEVNDSVLAQLDLLIMLRKAGCPLNLYDKVVDWIDHYTKKDKNIWSQNKLLHRKQFLDLLSNMYNTEGRQPQFRDVESPYDKRKITVPIFSFVEEVMSLLHDPEVMAPENIVEGYDVLTGRMEDGEFWEPTSISEDDLLSLPTPTDPNAMLGEVPTGTKFQNSVKRYCNKEYHMPIPLIFFYDEANLDMHGGLATSPLIFSFGFFKNCVRTRRLVWRVLALIPNLKIGKGRDKCKKPVDKCNEHHEVLREALRELQDIMNKGGFKTVINGRTVVLKFWIHFIIGDTSGHNDLCSHYNAHKECECPCRDCMCGGEKLTQLPPVCQAITLAKIRECEGDEAKMKSISQREVKFNVFHSLPMGNKLLNINGCCNYEILHANNQGVIMYTNISINEMVHIKKVKDKINDLFRVMSRYLERQSERDFPRRATRWASGEQKQVTAKETEGNAFCMSLCYHTKDGSELLQPFLPGTLTMTKLINTVQGFLCYGKWVNQPNSANEVIHAPEQIHDLMNDLQTYFPRKSELAWAFPKFHAQAKYPRQMCSDGDGSGWTSCHGEFFHIELSKQNARNTSKHYKTLARDMAHRVGENVTTQVACSMLAPHLMDDSGEVAVDRRQQAIETSLNTRQNRSYMNPALQRVSETSNRGGQYLLSIPAPTTTGEVAGASVTVRWLKDDKQLAMMQQGVKLFPELILAISNLATQNNWRHEIKVTGWSTIVKRDPTTNQDIRYRSDPKFGDREWRDWGIVDCYRGQLGANGLCPGWILGFIRFDQAGFPTPRNIELRQAGNNTCLSVDNDVYVVTRAATDVMNFDEKLVTPFRLVTGQESLYVIPMRDLVGPLACVPDIHTNEARFVQTVDRFFALKPYRRWGDHFAKSITY